MKKCESAAQLAIDPRVAPLGDSSHPKCATRITLADPSRKPHAKFPAQNASLQSSYVVAISTSIKVRSHIAH
jgi:hypothetical protein